MSFVDTGTLIQRTITDRWRSEELESAEKGGIKRILSAFFEIFQLELATHGLNRTFRFWTKAEKQRSLKHANAVVNYLRDNVGPACLGYGACLGAVRDGDLIPHDDDFDIIVARDGEPAADTSGEVELILAHLSEKGIHAFRCTDHHLKMSLQGGQIVDVFCAVNQAGKLNWHPGPKDLFEPEAIFPACDIQLLGVAVPVPRNVIHYLQSVYGPSWRKPRPFFSHSERRAELQKKA